MCLVCDFSCDAVWSVVVGLLSCVFVCLFSNVGECVLFVTYSVMLYAFVLVCSFSMLMRSVLDLIAFVLCFFVVECFCCLKCWCVSFVDFNVSLPGVFVCAFCV